MSENKLHIPSDQRLSLIELLSENRVKISHVVTCSIQ